MYYDATSLNAGRPVSYLKARRGTTDRATDTRMIPTIQILVLLLVVTAAVAVLAARLKISPAIILVLTGVALALIPGLPEVVLAPELVLQCCRRSSTRRRLP